MWGSSLIISHTDYRYYILFTYELSRFSWIYFYAHKSDVADIFAQFKSLIENLLTCTIKAIQADDGTKFKPIVRTYSSIQFYLSFPNTSQQSDLIKRKH
jgi:hypothetical protein